MSEKCKARSVNLAGRRVRLTTWVTEGGSKTVADIREFKMGYRSQQFEKYLDQDVSHYLSAQVEKLEWGLEVIK